MKTQNNNIGNLELDMEELSLIDSSTDAQNDMGVDALSDRGIEENNSSMISDIAAGVGAKARRFAMIASAIYGINTANTEAFDWSRFKKQPEVGARTLEKQSGKASISYEMYITNQKTDKSQLKVSRLLVDLPKAEEEKRRPMLSIASNRRKAPESISSLNTKADKMLAAAKEAVLSNPFDVVRLNFENLYELYDLYLEGGEDDMRVKTVISKLDNFLKDLEAKDKKAYEKTRVQTTLETVKLGVKLMENAWERGSRDEFVGGWQIASRMTALTNEINKKKFNGNNFARMDASVINAFGKIARGGGLEKALGVVANELISGYPSKQGILQNPDWDDVNMSPYHRDSKVSKNIKEKGSTEELLDALRPETSLELWKELRMLTRFDQVAKLAKDALGAKINVSEEDIKQVEEYLTRYEAEKAEAGGKYMKNFVEFNPPVKPKRVSKR